MRGACTRKVRSTPTPWAMRRTVKLVAQPDLALERDDDALEDLDALAGSFDDLDVHAHGVA